MKKIVAIVSMIAMVGMIVPSSAPAQATTIEELQAQIADLLATIATLQTQLTALQGGTTTAAPAACSGVTFDRNLKLGMTGDDVKCLQALLNQSSDTQVNASGAVGSTGLETTYFGSLTQAAVIKFQEKYASEVLASYGLTSGTGFVGSTTRAKLTSLLTAAATTPTTPTDETTTPTLPTAEGLTVEIASDNPAAATIVSDGDSQVAGSQALVPYLKVKFSTPEGTSAKVTTIKLKRIGISTDSDIPTAYLYDGDTKLAEMTSLSLGVVTFTNSAGLFTVSGAKTITVKADLGRDVTAGKTVGFSINVSSDITTDASTVNGTFPMNGNLMTTAVVADFGRLSITTSTNSVTVDPGITGFEAFRIILTAANQKIQVKSIKFLQLGSISSSDVANLGLYVGSTLIGSTVAALESDGTVTFDLGSYEIPAGVQRIVSLKMDVIGGSTRTIKFSIQRSTDVVAMDDNYGVYVQPDGGTIAVWSVKDSQATAVAEGNLVITRSTDSTSGNIALNSTNISLAKFDVKAVGEQVRVTTLTFNASSSGGDWANITNVRLFYDGVQVGTTQTTAASSTNYAITMSFTAPIGVTKALEIKADVRSSAAAVGTTTLAAGDGITMQLIAGNLNAQRLTSLGSFAFPGAPIGGNTLTVIEATLSAAKNSSIGDISAVNNQSTVTIGSYLVTAGAAEGVDISKFVFEDSASSTATAAGANNLGAAFTNLSLWYGSTQLGSTIVPNPTTPAAEYSFTPSTALSLATGQTVRVDLKVNVLSNGSANWTNGNATKLTRVESTGKVTTNAANFTPEVAGQGIALSGAGTLSGAVDPSSPNTAILAMSASQSTLGVWKLTADIVEDLTVSKIVVFNGGTAASVGNYNNLTLSCGSSQFGSAVVGLLPAVAGIGFTDPFAAFGGSCIVPKGSNALITLKSDITTYGNGAQAGEYGAFYVRVPAVTNGGSADSITARGAGDYANTTASTSTVDRMYTYRNSLTAALACNGSCTGRTRSTNDKIATLTLTGVSGAADAQLRAALPGEDDDDTGQWAITPVGAAFFAASATNTDAVNKLDGAASIKYTASSSNDGTAAVVSSTTWMVVNMGAGTGLNTYSKLSLMWRVDTVENVKAATLFVSSTTTNAWANRLASSSVATTTMVADKWFTAEMDLTNVTTTYAGLAIIMQERTVLNVLVDAVRVYNDSITVNITGNATDTNRGTPVYLKNTSGVQKAIGYYDYLNSKVVLVPSAEIAVGSSGLILEMITDTTPETGIIEVPAFGISRTLSLSTVLGNYTTAGDIRWYDQAVAVSSPITWLNGASPISVTLSLATGN